MYCPNYLLFFYLVVNNNINQQGPTSNPVPHTWSKPQHKNITRCKTYQRKNNQLKELNSLLILSNCIDKKRKTIGKLVNGHIKVAQDDIAFKLAIFKKSLHLNDNTCFCSIIQASKLVFGSLLAKKLLFCPILNKKFGILPDGRLWEWLTGGVALPQPKCNWSVGFAIARWPVGKTSDNARIMLSSLFRYSLV